MKLFLNTLLIVLTIFNTMVKADHERGHCPHHPHGPPPQQNPPIDHPERSHSEDSSEEQKREFFEKHHMPNEDLDHFKERMKRIHESVQICTRPREIESNQSENKQAIQKNSQNLQKIIDFHIVIRSLIDENQKKFGAIEQFVGYFKVNVPDDKIPEVIHEFILKVLEIEQKDSITLQMSNELAESIEKAQQTQDHQETVQEMNEEAKKLFAEKLEEFKHILTDLIQALKEIADKYNGQDNQDDVSVNNQEPEQNDQQSQNQEQQQNNDQQTQTEEQQQQNNEQEQPEENQNQTPQEETVTKQELNDQKEKFEQKLSQMEEKQKLMQQQLNDLLNNQQILNQQQKQHQDSISQIKTLENGLDDLQHAKTQDTVDVLNHIQKLQEHPDAQNYLKPLRDLYDALNPQSE